MYKVHLPHLKSGYLAKVEFQEQRGEGGELDWLMLYTPGRRAQAEFKEASKKPRTIQRPPATKAVKPTNEMPRTLTSPAPNTQPVITASGKDDPEQTEQLVSRLTKFHISEATARELVRDYRRSVELQLKALPYRNSGKIKDLASWLIKAIRTNYELPEAMQRGLEKEAEVRRELAKREAEKMRQRRREALQPAFYDYLRAREGEHQKERQKAYSAFLAQEAGKRSDIENNRLYKPKLKGKLLSDFDHEEAHLDRLREYFKDPTLDEWIELNPDE
jgi:hypothetical protein